MHNTQPTHGIPSAETLAFPLWFQQDGCGTRRIYGPSLQKTRISVFIYLITELLPDFIA